MIDVGGWLEAARFAAKHLIWGAVLGLAWASCAIVSQPFARIRVGKPVTLALILTAATTTWLASERVALAVDTMGPIALGLLIGTAVAVAGGRRLATAGGAVLIPNADVRRAKFESDRWILILGPTGSGRSTLVDAMLMGAQRGSTGQRNWHIIGNSVDGWEQDRVQEVAIARGTGQYVFRFWERDAIPGPEDRFPSFRELDGIVVLVDPTQEVEVASTFPLGLRRSDSQQGASALLTEIESVSLGSDVSPLVWVAISKSDLLPFSVHQSLVRLVSVGPAWREQLRMMPVADRARIASLLGLHRIIDGQHHFRWGPASPLLIAAAPPDRWDTGFGETQLFDLLVTSL